MAPTAVETNEQLYPLMTHSEELSTCSFHLDTNDTRPSVPSSNTMRPKLRMAVAAADAGCMPEGLAAAGCI